VGRHRASPLVFSGSAPAVIVEWKGASEVDWKSFYRRELERPEGRERATVWLESDPDPWVGDAVDRSGIVSFPHTALAYAGPLQAAVVSALYRRRIDRVVALGVLHGGGLTPYRAALDEDEAVETRSAGFEIVRGAFTDGSSEWETPFGLHPALPASGDSIRVDRAGLLTGEFSLDTFCALLRLGSDVFGRPPIPVEPIFVGMTRDPVSGSFAEARRLAAWVRGRIEPATALVATGDVVHYGTPYGPLDRGLLTDPTTLERAFEFDVRKTLSLALEAGDLEQAYRRSRDVLRSDQRELLPVVAAHLGVGASFEIVSFELSDYAGILSVDPPCLVASAFLTYG